MTNHKYIRKVSTCYILQEDTPFATDTIKICQSRKLAEHYKRILEPKWKEAFGVDLRIVEEHFHKDLSAEDTERIHFASDQILTIFDKQIKKLLKELDDNYYEEDNKYILIRHRILNDLKKEMMAK